MKGKFFWLAHVNFENYLTEQQNRIIPALPNYYYSLQRISEYLINIKDLAAYKNRILDDVQNRACFIGNVF